MKYFNVTTQTPSGRANFLYKTPTRRQAQKQAQNRRDVFEVLHVEEVTEQYYNFIKSDTVVVGKIKV